mmetsp:Transcript_30680/g.52487  ORF Transcript_30680/g.52487 Transcript_30680/m.52487 type:complete len:135 (-) Transcript_30680:210-614(-)
MKYKDQLNELGVSVVAVGTGSKLFASKFKESVSFEGEVLIDKDAEMFKAIDLPRLSIWEVTKRFIFNLTGLSLYRELHSKYPDSDTKGDGQQTGGVFVIGPGTGKEILFQFRESDNEVEDFANPDDILEACKKE